MNKKIENSRTKNAALNISSNVLVLIIKTVFVFITRTTFIYCLGKESLGLNGLFTNILSMLSLAELGIGQAINFSLYKPLSEKNNNNISKLMSFYRKIYRVIGIIVLTFGIILIPFLQYLIKDLNTIKNVYIIYLLFLINSVFTYFISYKETLIIADQKRYELLKIEALFTILLNTLQIIFLLITKNFIVYLIIQFITTFIQRIITNVYISKKYNNIDFKCKEKIDESDKEIIKKNVKAMIFHKIGDYCINGTDNLIISSFINIVTVGIYSNYLTIISLLNSFVLTIYNGLTASLGNLIATENSNKRYTVFKKMNFISFLIHGLLFVLLITIFNDFITIWIGKDYCLSFDIVLAIMISFYLTGMRVPCGVAKSAAGIYDIDKYSPILQSIINLFISIFLVKRIGLLGVILGTIVSSIALPSWQRPYIVYKYILHQSSKEYFIDYIKYLLIIAVDSIVSLYLCNYILLSSLLLTIIIKALISLIIYSTTIFIFYRHSDEFTYINKFIRGVFKWKMH